MATGDPGGPGGPGEGAAARTSDAVSAELSAAARDFFGGTVGGMMAILAGHPLDTAKTRIQAMARFDQYSTARVLTETARLEGFRALYRGMSVPFYSTALLNAVVFCAQGVSERLLQDALGRDRPQLTGFLAGCLAGLAQSPLVCLVDLVKTQRQVQFTPSTSGPQNWSPGPWRILRERVKMLGLRHGCLQGLGATAVKECPSYGVYFLVYEESRRHMDLNHVPVVLSTLVSGGFAGCFALGMIHPVDVVKSRIQSLPLEATASERSVRQTVAQGLAREGPAFFLRGFGAAMQRAFVFNAATFGGVEFAVALWDRSLG
ncbi:SLC25A29 [Symbiodinium natans]|uniref:SLC25A29 protein n=1 Tax=Symbiodinium natans TaxID=878477 RepID=A0A812K4V0_9DINO|nr:SLC25A29 [Symbiodinium natans]